METFRITLCVFQSILPQAGIYKVQGAEINQIKSCVRRTTAVFVGDFVRLIILLCVQESRLEYIKPKEMPDELAKKAYDDGYYIEAIQVIHGWLENQARSFLMLVGCVHFDSKQSDAWDLSDTISLNDTLKVLRILNQISTEELSNFKKFNTLRNKMVHQYFKSPYEKEYHGIPKREYDEVFEETIRQAYFFTEKCEAIVG